jgi:ABC-2 type transport system permease protein
MRVILELFSLKLRLLVNAFRSLRSAAWAGFGILLAACVVVLLWTGASLATELDAVTRHRVVVVTGALVSLGAFFVPLVVARSQLLHPRAFWLVGFGRPAIAGAVLFTTLVGPALVLVPIALSPLWLWAGDAAGTAALMVPLIVLEGLLAARIGVVIGAVLRYRPAVSALIRLIAALLLIVGAVVIAAHLVPTVAALLPGAWWRNVLPVVIAVAPLRDPLIAETLTGLPLGAFWRAPSHQAAGDTALVTQDVALGVLTIVVLLVVWLGTLAFQLRATRRRPRQREALVPGWFRRLPSTPVGAVAARSFTYWARDPRYRAALVLLPVVPVVTIVAFTIVGIPLSISSLLPLPIVVLLLAWGTLHNDVAYDSTGIWSHLAAQIRGVDDRVGRMLPVLAMGVPVVLIGTPLTAWAHGDWFITPAVFGVGTALLLGGVGVSSLISARFPYPATRPGDAAFQQPQVPGASGSGIQFWSIVLILLVASPAIAATVFGLLGVAGPWNWIALVAGVAAGVLVLVLGIRVGGAAFDRRAPELLEFAARH